MAEKSWKLIAFTSVACALLAACGPTEPPAPTPPPPPPPPPPVVEVESVPYRPLPPRGAAYQMEVPTQNAAGEWLTINYGLGEDETVWHFRSGWNVAALNCLGPQDEIITSAYGDFLRGFPNGLRSTNSRLDQQYRREHSSSRAAIRAREQHSTRVYNYFALPGARADLCAAARQIATEFGSYEGRDVKALAALYLPVLEQAYIRFFSEYAEYQRLSADWDRQYGAQYGASQPGYVAIYGNGGSTGSVASSLISGQAPEPIGSVIDPETGEAVPVIPVDEGSISTPVVQPIPQE